MPASTRRIASPLLFKWESSFGLDSQNRLWALSGNRAVTATYDRGGTVGAASAVDANGRPYIPGYRTPRWHHQYNASTGSFDPVGLLLEGARTNAYTYSRLFTNAAWQVVNSSFSAASAAGPDGTTSGFPFLESAAVGEHYAYQTLPALTDNTRSTVYFIVKGNGRNWCTIRTVDKAATALDSYFNLTTGATGTIAAGHTAFTAHCANGYYLVGVSFDAAAGGGTPVAFLFPASADNTVSYAGDITKGLYVFHAQFEADKASPSLPISTAAAAVTRSSDALSFALNAVPQAMTVYADVVDLGSISLANSRIWQIGNNAGPYVLLSNYTGTQFGCVFDNGPTTVASQLAAAPTFSQRVELRCVMAATGAVTIGQSIDSAAETTGAASAANALPSAWSATTLFVGLDDTPANHGAFAVRSLRIAAGVQTMATMRQM